MNLVLTPPSAGARCIVALALSSALAAHVVGHPGTPGADPFADSLVEYAPGTGGKSAYDDPTTAIGAPERFTGEDGYPGVVSPFYPAFGIDEIVSIGCGGRLVLGFDEPVTDDPDNPFGIDLIVFGNASFIDANWPDAVVGGLFGAEGGRIEVSVDGGTWIEVPGVEADGLFPTNGYLDVGPYDFDPGAVESDFTRPVDPAVTLDDMLGLPYAGVLAVYDGAGGGAGVDLALTGLAAISFVRITNPCGEEVSLEIDAVSDVAPIRAGDANRDGVIDFGDILVLLGGWGDCPPPPRACPADLDANGIVDFADILVVLANWVG